ncbi:hypothetical protein [Halochromatium roseum]|uniref:hypothetical protein n=1 Tax=Halochromatium roseum TaxID=391920 RepID=UPI001913D216|nr:hypothetical protein [Halochromatium roseum]
MFEIEHSDLPILVQIVDWVRIPVAFREEQIEVGSVVLQPPDGYPAALPSSKDVDAG